MKKVFTQVKVSILSNMTSAVLKASDADNGGSLDHVRLVKCLNTITLLSQISAEFTRKRKHNQRNIVNSDFLPLFGPKTGTIAAKVKPKKPTVYLLGDNLKQAAKDACRSQKLSKKDYKKDFKGNRQTQARDQTKFFLDYGKNGGQNYNQPSQQRRPPFYNNNNNNNKNNTNWKPYHSTVKKYRN